jgi:transposase
MMGEPRSAKTILELSSQFIQASQGDHPLRRIEEVLKLDFVRGEVARFYGRKGNVSEDPVVIVKMMILLFLDDVRSERELMRIIPERLDYMWFLGYGLDDVIPNHSVLSKARKRWRQELFDRLFYGS